MTQKIEMKPLAIPELERMLEGGCGVPGCGCKDDNLYLTQRCHPQAGVDACYHKGTGILTISCRRCDAKVADIAVALVSV